MLFVDAFDPTLSTMSNRPLGESFPAPPVSTEAALMHGVESRSPAFWQHSEADAHARTHTM